MLRLRKVRGMTSSKWHETRKAKMDELFSGKSFRIVEEFNSDVAVATPLGYKIKNGYKLQEIGEEVNYIVVGKSLLNTLAEEYNAVDKPEPKKRGRPKKEPLELAEEWANRDMSDDASPVTQPGPTYTNPNETQEFKG